MGERRPERSFGASSGRSVQFGAVSSLTSDIDSTTLHVGWTMGTFPSLTPERSTVSHWGQNPSLCLPAVRSLRRGTDHSLDSVLPREGDKNLRDEL